MSEHNEATAVDVTGKRAIAAVDFRHARVYAVDAATHSRPESIDAADPWHLNHNVYHRAGNVDGTYDIDRIDTDEFFKTLAVALHNADEVLLLGHGKGKANASHLFYQYLERHYSDVAAKVVADVRCDIDDLTDNQLLRLGEMYFGADEPVRDYGDSRRGEPHQGEATGSVAHLNNHHTDTLTAIFDHAASGNIRWVDVESLLGSVGTIEQRHDGRFKVQVGAETEIFDRPHGKDISVQQVVDLRRMLRNAGYSPQAPGKEV